MVELKVNVDGVQRVVCGVSEATRCQDVVLALAQATGQRGRFNLVERRQDAERSLRPQERPLRVMSAWGPDARRHAHFLMRRVHPAAPGHSRPPSVTEGVVGEGASTLPAGGFAQKRQASVRRSQTFSGYRIGGSIPVDRRAPSTTAEESDSDANRCRELTETLVGQRDRIASQRRDLAELEELLRALCEYDTAGEDAQAAMEEEEEEEEEEVGDPDRDPDEMEARYRRNKAELRELEFWENELEVEGQLREALERRAAKAGGRLARCQEELSARQREAESLARQVAEAEATAARLTEMREEIGLLLREQEDCVKSSQEMDAALAELDHLLEEKRAEEARLTEELARANMADFSQASAETEPSDEAVTHSTHSVDRLSWQRTQSPASEAYATFPFRRLVSARHLAAEKTATEDQPEGVFV